MCAISVIEVDGNVKPAETEYSIQSSDGDTSTEAKNETSLLIHTCTVAGRIISSN